MFVKKAIMIRLPRLKHMLQHQIKLTMLFETCVDVVIKHNVLCMVGLNLYQVLGT